MIMMKALAMNVSSIRKIECMHLVYNCLDANCIK